jgi:hypothetical protein
MTAKSFPAWSGVALRAAVVLALCGCGSGTVTFGSGDGNNNDDPTVTVTGNIRNVDPITSRDIVVFAYGIAESDSGDRCPCPANPFCATSTNGKVAVVSSGETEFTLSGVDAGPLGLVFLLDNSGNNADGEINPGDPIAVLDDSDCELDSVDGNITVTLKDVDITFADATVPVCRDTATDCDEVHNSPAPGRARAFLITQATTKPTK